MSGASRPILPVDFVAAMSSFYGKKLKNLQAQAKRQRQVSKPSVNSAASHESTMTTPMRKTHQAPAKKRRITLQPAARQDNEANQRLQLHYKPGIELTAINSHFPVDDDSADSENSFEDGDLSGDFSVLCDPNECDPSILPEDSPSFSNSLPEKILISMIQHQQAMLEQVLEGQKHLVERQDGFEDQLAELTSKVEQPLPSTPSSSSSEGKRKHVVTRTLSVSLC